ncbi:hypothetical protein [Streptomyces sp. 1331.2]|uniref:hypothetical protein n=1 Tax=Streptomyces sp. 1331.2 TaxID=1938835 RepID=UPI000BD59BD5|nr:hypothetical protein [Streptomyces sp. 1331.2]SOB88695.1 hypothetical protein SAMN06272789_6986 [Streptomyces sp. 1331.2]
MFYDDYDYLPALFTAVADPSEEKRTVDGWRIERVGPIQGAADHCTIHDPLGWEGMNVPMRPGGTPVYLVSREDAPAVPVAALVHPTENVPVRMDDCGDGLATPSGLVVLHADPSTTRIEPAARMLERTWATLHARAAEGSGWLLENFRESLRDASVDPSDWPVDPIEGDFANDWLMIPDEAGTGTVLGILVSPDGCNTTACLDADGKTVATLLTFDH